MPIEVQNQDPETEEGWKEVVRTAQEWLSRVAAQEEWGVAEVSLVLTQDPATGERLPGCATYAMATVFEGPNPDEAKEMFLQVVKAMALAGRAVAIIFSSEAWFSTQSADKQVVRPSESPDRQEALFMVAEHQSFGNAMHRALVTTENGKRHIAEWELLDGEVQGRFHGLLPPKHFYQDDKYPSAVKLAQAVLAAYADCMQAVDLRRGEA